MKNEMNVYYSIDWIAVFIDGSIWHFGDDELSFADFALLQKQYPDGFDYREFVITEGKENYSPSLVNILTEQAFRSEYFKEC